MESAPSPLCTWSWLVHQRSRSQLNSYPAKCATLWPSPSLTPLYVFFRVRSICKPHMDMIAVWFRDGPREIASRGGPIFEGSSLNTGGGPVYYIERSGGSARVCRPVGKCSVPRAQQCGNWMLISGDKTPHTLSHSNRLPRRQEESWGEMSWRPFPYQSQREQQGTKTQEAKRRYQHLRLDSRHGRGYCLALFWAYWCLVNPWESGNREIEHGHIRNRRAILRFLGNRRDGHVSPRRASVPSCLKSH